MICRTLLAIATAAPLLALGCGDECGEDGLLVCKTDSDQCFCSMFCTEDMVSAEECTPAKCSRAKTMDLRCRDSDPTVPFAWQCDADPGPLCRKESALPAGEYCCTRGAQ